MGVDAEMLIKVKGKEKWLSPQQVLALSVRMTRTIGHQHFMVTKDCDDDFYKKFPEHQHHAISIIEPWTREKAVADYGEEDVERWGETTNFGKTIYRQDGDNVIAEPDEQFLRVHLWGRYYGPGYARGHWPTYDIIIRFLYTVLPAGSEVWYGGDSGGICVEHVTPEFLDDMMRFYFNSGNSTYVGAFSGISGSGAIRPMCDCCETPMLSNGGGPQGTMWYCESCDRIAVTDKIGKEVLKARSKQFTGEGQFKLFQAFLEGQRGKYKAPEPKTKDPN